MATQQDVRNYWEKHPLLSHEVENWGSEEFFDKFDKIKRTDAEPFSMNYWEFDNFKGQKVLDVGCGPGWITVNYALGGAELTSIDITQKAVDITKKHCEYRGVTTNAQRASAEDIPFKDNYFDFVVSSGVLHHTPDTPKAISECYRVLKPGHRSKITLYYRGILHNQLVFPIVRTLMNIFKVKHPGADLAKDAKNVDDFIRQYDGAGNPVGIAHTKKEWVTIFNDIGFQVTHSELHFFPVRFIPFKSIVPKFVHFLLDRYFGIMIYFDLVKPK